MVYILDADWVINTLAGRRRADAILSHLTRIPNVKLYRPN